MSRKEVQLIPPSSCLTRSDSVELILVVERSKTLWRSIASLVRTASGAFSAAHGEGVKQGFKRPKRGLAINPGDSKEQKSNEDTLETDRPPGIQSSRSLLSWTFGA